MSCVVQFGSRACGRAWLQSCLHFDGSDRATDLLRCWFLHVLIILSASNACCLSSTCIECLPVVRVRQYNTLSLQRLLSDSGLAVLLTRTLMPWHREFLVPAACQHSCHQSCMYACVTLCCVLVCTNSLWRIWIVGQAYKLALFVGCCTACGVAAL